MTSKGEYIVDLIFKKLKNYKAKEIFLELMFKFILYNFSSLTIFLIITFIISLYFLYKITSNEKS